MTLEERIAHWEIRQEALIASIHGLVDIMETVRDVQAELMAWLQQPPSTDLPELFKGLTAAIQEHSDLLVDLSRRVDTLPERLAR